jgi:rhodanese-related sulfurtransferase
MKSIVAINQGREPFTDPDPLPVVVAAAEAARLIEDGCLVVDGRSQIEFGEGAIPGSVNVPQSSSKFEQNIGWFAPEDAGLLLASDDPELARAALHKLAFVGLERRVRGVVSIESWKDAGLPLDHLPQVDVDWLSRQVAESQVRVLDVRPRTEWLSGHIDSARHVEFERLATFGGPEFPLGEGEPLTHFEIKYAVEERKRYRASWIRETRS